MPYVPYMQRVWSLQVRNVFHVWLVNSNGTPNRTAGLEQCWACSSGRMWLLHPIYRRPVIASPIIPNKRWKSHKQLFRPSWASSVAYWWMCRDVWLPAYVCTYVHKLHPPTPPPGHSALFHCRSLGWGNNQWLCIQTLTFVSPHHIVQYSDLCMPVV